MNPDDKTKLLIGSLAGAVILVVGYGLYRELGGSSQVSLLPAIQPAQVQTEITAEPAAGAPSIRLQADNPVIAGTTGHQASVTGDQNLQYEWSIQGGTLEGVTTADSVTWNAGTGADAILTCKVTNTAGKSSTVSQRITLRQPPSIARFEAIPAVISIGNSARLSWSVGNAEKLTLNPGGQDLTKYTGPAFEVKPTETATYTLTAANSTGITVTSEVKVKVVALPEIVSLRADPVSGSPDAYAVSADFKGGKAELTNGGLVVGGGETAPLRFQLSGLKEGSTLNLKVTNEAGAYATATLTFTATKK